MNDEKPKAKTGPVRVRIAYRCPECGRTWTVNDDANEWVYGHDCE